MQIVVCLESRICRVYYVKSRVFIDNNVQTFKYIESKVYTEYFMERVECRELSVQRVYYVESRVQRCYGIQCRINDVFCMMYGLGLDVSKNARNSIGRFYASIQVNVHFTSQFTVKILTKGRRKAIYKVFECNEQYT